MALIDNVHQLNFKVIEAFVLLYLEQLKLRLKDLKLGILDNFGFFVYNL